MADVSHEAQVAAFLAEKQLEDPERYAAICARYPVKSKRQSRSIAEIELSAGLQPLKVKRRLENRRTEPLDVLEESA